MPSCQICANPKLAKKTDTWATQGMADREVARRLRLDKSAVNRHRLRHIVKPAQDRLALVARDRPARQERQQLAAAASSDAPSPQQFVEAFFSLKAQAEKLDRIEQRLERVAVVAETNGSASSVAQLSAQQLRSVEVGARLSGLPHFVPQRSIDQPGASPNTFSINIVFSGSGRTETISVTGAPPPNIIDGHDELNTDSSGLEFNSDNATGAVDPDAGIFSCTSDRATQFSCDDPSESELDQDPPDDR
jgi:hypothetical protein